MATHNLFHGGQRVANPQYRMYPQVAPKPNDPFQADNRRAPAMFPISRALDFRCGAGCRNCDTLERKDNTAFSQYIRENTIAVGDVIRSHIIPRHTLLSYVHWRVDSPVAGVTFSLRFRPSTDDAAVVTNIALATNVSAAAEATGLIDVPAMNGGDPLYTAQNGYIELVVTALPAAAPSTGCSDCGNVGPISGLVLCVSPVIIEFCRGDCA